jgi:ribosome-associated protein
MQADRSDENYVSKSEYKRGAQEIHRLAEALVDLKASDYAKAPLDEDMRAHVDLARRIDAQIARKRQILFVAKQLRKRTEELGPLFLAIDKPKSEQKKETARMHRLERWRDRMLIEGDDALSEFLKEHPKADRQALRSLIRSATAAKARADEAAANDRPIPRNDGSYSALYKMLGDIERGAHADSDAHAADAAESDDAQHD